MKKTVKTPNWSYIRKDSPTQNVGAFLKTDLESITHTYQMMSLGDVFNFEELKDFDEKIKKDVREILEISSKDNVQEKIAKKRLSEITSIASELLLCGITKEEIIDAVNQAEKPTKEESK